MNPHRRALVKQGLAELSNPLMLFAVVGAGFAFALGVGYIGYAANPKGSFGNSAAAGIGLLIGLGIWLIAIVWLVASGGVRGLVARLRHETPIRPDKVLERLPGESIEQSVARFMSESARSDIRFGIGLIAVCVAGGLGLLLGGLHERTLTQAEPGWTTTRGFVQSSELLGCKGGCEWSVVVAFTVPGKGTYRFKPPASRDQPILNSSVLVAYPPSNPSAAHDLSDTNNESAALLWLSPVVVLTGLAFGGIMILSGRSDQKTASTYPPLSP